METNTWIENLALEELNMEESGVIHFSEHLSPHHFLEEASLEYMEKLREEFEIAVSKFNLYRNNQQNSIKMFKISNSVNDFMLFRNSLKLIVARKGPDLITLFLTSHAGNHFATGGGMANKSAILCAHELKAHVGPFHDIGWKYNGEEIVLPSLVKHYLTEFIRQSAR